jgi:1,4-alpha-glucan branching enzyme
MKMNSNMTKIAMKNLAKNKSGQMRAGSIKDEITLLTDYDIHLFNEGTHNQLYEKLGAHITSADGMQGTYFAVWAPNARRVSVIGDFNSWNGTKHPLQPRAQSGIWEGFIPNLSAGALYKYAIASQYGGYQVQKADPLAFSDEVPPRTASIISGLEYSWNDSGWMSKRESRNRLAAPMSIYEVHLGSWRRIPEEANRFLKYRELAPQLAKYVKEMDYTHVEFLPVMEHPFYGSWGYQITGYYAPTSRYGPPQDFMYLIDYLHQHDIGVFLDWVPSHFSTDEHGLGFFDGTHLYEHADPRKGVHPDWNSYIFNYARNEVSSFLLSNAIFWLDKYHADGIRLDAVASMLYLDYSRKEGEWIPNQHGGRENLEAIAFLRRLNETVYMKFPGVQTIAEESTAWPMVSKPTYLGGLGFGIKWDMGWMHDTLEYMQKDPIYRKYHHRNLTFHMLYSFSENFVLPLSHDEVVHGKGSLLGKMPGDDWQKFANLRLLFAYMYALPGKKLLFMGGDFGQRGEWNHDESLEWHLLRYAPYEGLRRWVKDLNRTYRSEEALNELDFESAGFEWIDCNDTQQSVISFIRRGSSSDTQILVALNFTPVPYMGYRIGVPHLGQWQELLNSDAKEYEGSGMGNFGSVSASRVKTHGRPASIGVTLPPLAAVFFRNEGEH